MHGSGKNSKICTDQEKTKEYARIWKKIKEHARIWKTLKNMHGSGKNKEYARI